MYREYKTLNLPEIDREVLDFWDRQRVFEKSILRRDPADSYVFYEGPPSANGLPGIHHVMARTIKDLFCRYHTMKGQRVDRKGGWDTHGLPIEIQVEKELGITKEDIGKTISVDEYNRKCRETVMRYKDLWDDITRKMGYWVDLDNPYITYENDYIESVWWLLQQLYAKGLLYKGYTIQPYSPAAGTGLSSHELNMPGAYRDISDTSAVAQFRIKGTENEYFLAWTTTPWTLPSNTALAVGANIIYLRVRTFNRYTGAPIVVILAKDRMGAYFSELNPALNPEDVKPGNKPVPYLEIVDEMPGSALEGIEYEQLMPYVQPDKPAFRVLLGDFVSTEDGTGIVHIAPTFGADDFKVAKQYGIPPLLVKDENGQPMPLVDRQGRFVKEVSDFAGRYVKDYGQEEERPVDVDIVIKLKEEGKLFLSEKYVHPYPHCWRTDRPVLYYPLDSWFIRASAMKERLFDLNLSINWKPASTGEGRFGKWLENLQDWNLSRSRYWGIPLPIWRSEDGKVEKCIGSVAELTREIARANEKLGKTQQVPADLHRPYIDEIVLTGENGELLYRELDLIDVWFDSGAVPYAQWHFPGADGQAMAKEAEERARSLYGAADPAVLAQLKMPETGLSPAGKVLWDLLQQAPFDSFPFRQQYPIGELTVDFVYPEKLLVVLVGSDAGEAQTLKTSILQTLGYHVLRLSEELVLNDTAEAMARIKEALAFRPSFTEAMQKQGLHFLPPFGATEGSSGGFPADFIAEGVDQTRGWFYTLHAIAGMVFDSVSFKNVVSNGLVLDKNGHKMSKRLGNAVDPFQTIATYGADATRWYMISNAQPWDNLKFDIDGVEEVRRSFFGTLFNTYSFFALYANIDRFAYAEEVVPLDRRPEIDRWIISLLNTLVKEVDADYADYEVTNATRRVMNFVDEHLSNWYVRLCRRRFWKGDYTEDKIAAYQTLYDGLNTIAKLMAPVAPFFADWLYRNLNEATGKESHESVHLADFPAADPSVIDKALEQRMDYAQRISSLVRSLRKKEKIRVRQPLQKILLPILDESFQQQIEGVKDLIQAEVNVKEIEYVTGTGGFIKKKIRPNFKTLGKRLGKHMKPAAEIIAGMDQEEISTLEKTREYTLSINGDTFDLTLDDFEITAEDIPGWLVASDGPLTVALDITLTDELLAEGMARELVNRIQNIRKNKDFNVTDRIVVTLERDEAILPAVEQFGHYIQNETLADQLILVDEVERGEQVELPDERRIGIAVEAV